MVGFEALSAQLRKVAAGPVIRVRRARALLESVTVRPNWTVRADLLPRSVRVARIATPVAGEAIAAMFHPPRPFEHTGRKRHADLECFKDSVEIEGVDVLLVLQAGGSLLETAHNHVLRLLSTCRVGDGWKDALNGAESSLRFPLAAIPARFATR